MLKPGNGIGVTLAWEIPHPTRQSARLRTENEYESSANGVHGSNIRFSHLGREYHDFFGHVHDGDGNGDVLSHDDASYLRDGYHCGSEAGQEEVQGNRIVGARRYLQLMGLSG